MPEQRAPQEPRDVDLETIEFIFREQKPEDSAAVKLVVETFGRYEGGRREQERRWMAAERLYNGVVDERKWPGTDVKRAALPVPIVYDQVEAAFPIITEALFSYYPSFFEVKPAPGVSPAQAAQVRDAIADILDTPYDETGLTAIPHMKLAVRQAEIYGDGVVELSWDASQGRFVVEWADLRDVYLDPSTPGPLVDWSPALIHLKRMTVEELKDLRGVEGVRIPPDAVLNYMAKSQFISSGDMVKQTAAAAMRESYPVGELRTDPRHQTIEVLVYWTRDRLIWVLNRQWCAINEDNPFGFIPYCKAPFTVVPGRPYGKSLADVLEGDQKYAQGIRNARLDNLSLALNPPRVRAQGTPTPPSATAWRPGLEDRVSDPKQVEVVKVENVTSDAFQEEALIHSGASRRTGVNEFAQSGIPAPSNANRSATGVVQQVRAINQRLRTAVENFENFMIVPMLYKVQAMMEKFAEKEVETSAGAVSAEVFRRPVKFVMEAASRMVTKDRLALFLQPISMLLFNDAVARQANLQGMTLDFTEWERFFQDATATARTYKFFRPMNEQEKAAAQQPDPKAMIELVKARMEAETRLAMGRMKAETEDRKTRAKTMTDLSETGEASARKILELLAKEREKKSDDGEKARAGESQNSGRVRRAA